MNLSNEVMKGTVKWFDGTKGFGFITCDCGTDLFAHFSDIKMEGYKNLAEGDSVEFTVDITDRGKQAKNIVKL